MPWKMLPRLQGTAVGQIVSDLESSKGTPASNSMSHSLAPGDMPSCSSGWLTGDKIERKESKKIEVQTKKVLHLKAPHWINQVSSQLKMIGVPLFCFLLRCLMLCLRVACWFCLSSMHPMKETVFCWVTPYCLIKAINDCPMELLASSHHQEQSPTPSLSKWIWDYILQVERQIIVTADFEK